MAKEKPKVISLIERDTLVIMTALEDGDDELSLVPAGYYQENPMCHVLVKRTNDI